MSKLLIVWRRILVLLLLISTVAGPTSLAFPAKGRRQTPQRPARPFPPTQYIPSHDFDTRHVVLNLHFDWEQQRLIGTEKLTFASLVKDLSKIELDAADMTVTSVALTSGSALKYEANATKQKLWIVLDRVYQPADELTLVIDYRTNGSSRITGLVGGGLRFISPPQTIRP